MLPWQVQPHAPLPPGPVHGAATATDAELVTALVGALPSARLGSILDRAEGNPFFLEELAHQPDGALPDTVAELVLFRIERLPEPARQLLRLAAVHGPRFGHRALERTAGLPTDALLAALRQAIDHRMLVADGDGYAFRHALIQECTYRALLPAERQPLHESVAVTLSTSDNTAPGELARHWDAAGHPAEALHASLAAAHAAQRAHAPAESYLHYRRVLDLWDQVPDAAELTGTARDELLLPAAEVASHAGRNSEAEVLVRARLASTAAQDHERRARSLIALRRILQRGGRTDAADAVVTELLPLVPGLAGPSRAQALITVSRQYSITGHYLLGWRYGEQALAVAREQEDPGLIADAGSASGYAQLALGIPGGLALLREALTLHRQQGSGRGVAVDAASATSGLLELHRYEEAVALSGEVLAELGLYGFQASALPIQRGNLMEGLFGCGRWDDAEEMAHRISPSGVTDRSTCAEAIYGVLVLVGRGHHDRATALLDAGDRVLREITDAQLRWDWALEYAELHLWRGDFAAAEAAITTAMSLLQDRDCVGRLLATCRLGARLEADRIDATRLRRGAADPAAADRAAGYVAVAAAAVDRIAAATGHRAASFERHLDVVRAEHHRLVDEADPGRWAVVAARADGEPYLRAYAHWREAEALLSRHTAPAQAATALRAAHEIATRLDAEPLLTRLTDLARRARIELTTADKGTELDAAPAPGSELGLTERELDVLRLVGRGLSNGQIALALFISPKTVSVHVTNILRKLDLTSRVQAAAVAHRAGLT